MVFFNPECWIETGVKLNSKLNVILWKRTKLKFIYRWNKSLDVKVKTHKQRHKGFPGVGNQQILYWDLMTSGILSSVFQNQPSYQIFISQIITSSLKSVFMFIYTTGIWTCVCIKYVARLNSKTQFNSLKTGTPAATLSSPQKYKQVDPGLVI